jgi:formyltetrahydrofolate hydrolase
MRSAAGASGHLSANPFPTTRLLVSCPAQPDVAQPLAHFLSGEAVDVLGIDQRTSSDGRMFIRAELQCAPGIRHPVASGFRVPWQHVPVDKDRKSESERRLSDMLAGCFDLVVLARYMQILSGDFLRSLACLVINVHHSLLPAFVGAGTYERRDRNGGSR